MTPYCRTTLSLNLGSPTDRPGRHRGIGGATSAHYGTVDLEIREGPSIFRWSAYVGFYAEVDAILGHKGFLNVFTAIFDGRGHHLELTPNGTALPPAFSTP